MFKPKDIVVCMKQFSDFDEGERIPECGGIYRIKAVGIHGYIYLEEEGLGYTGWNADYFVDVKLWGMASRAVIALKIKLGFNAKTI